VIRTSEEYQGFPHSMNSTSLVINRWPCVCKVRNAEIAILNKFQYFVIDVIIVFNSIDSDGSDTSLAKNRLDYLREDNVYIPFAEGAGAKASQLSHIPLLRTIDIRTSFFRFSHQKYSAVNFLIQVKYCVKSYK